MATYQEIDQQIKDIQVNECVKNQCDALDRNACGHTTEINHETPEDSIFPHRADGDICPCSCHTLYAERDRLVK